MTSGIDETVILLALPDKYPTEFFNRKDHEGRWEEEVDGVSYLLLKFSDSTQVDVYKKRGYTEDKRYALVSYVGGCERQLKEALKERGYGEMFNFFNPPRNTNVPNQDVTGASE